ncbi:unnamed protein product, partial [Discosporangium mesarthrocarpum]
MKLVGGVRFAVVCFLKGEGGNRREGRGREGKGREGLSANRDFAYRVGPGLGDCAVQPGMDEGWDSVVAYSGFEGGNFLGQGWLLVGGGIPVDSGMATDLCGH